MAIRSLIIGIDMLLTVKQILLQLMEEAGLGSGGHRERDRGRGLGVERGGMERERDGDGCDEVEATRKRLNASIGRRAIKWAGSLRVDRSASLGCLCAVCVCVCVCCFFSRFELCLAGFVLDSFGCLRIPFALLPSGDWSIRFDSSRRRKHAAQPTTDQRTHRTFEQHTRRQQTTRRDNEHEQYERAAVDRNCLCVWCISCYGE